MDYKNTLNLPQTDFPMKADLVTREPARLKQWETAGLYAAIQAQRAGAEKFVLHDGPPFANGDVHIGTALNKILKDIIIKYKTPARLQRALRAGLGLPRPADRIQGHPGHAQGGRYRLRRRHHPQGLRGLRAQIHRHPARPVQAARRARGLGQPVPDARPRNTRRRSCACSPTSWSRALSIAARSRSIGASPAAPRWRRPRSNTKTTSARACM